MRKVRGLGILLVLLLHIFTSVEAIANEKEKAKQITCGGKIIFQHLNKNGEHIFLLDERIDNVRRLTHIGNNIQPRWSPDGKKIAFASIREGHKWEIYVMDSDGENQKRLTYTKDGFSTQPRWSSNGKEIYFFSNVKGDLQENTIELKTGKVKILYHTGKLKEIKPIQMDKLIEELQKKSEKELKKMTEELEKETTKVIEKSMERFKTFPSPDGRYKILYYPSRKMVLMDKKIKIETILEMGDEPAWSKDSKKLAYFVGDIPKGTLAIYNINRKQYEKITVPKGDNEECFHPSWSYDSKRIVYACGPVAGPEEPWLYILDLNTKKSTKLTQGSNPDWY